MSWTHPRDREKETQARVEEIDLVHLPTGEMRTHSGPAYGMTASGADFMFREGNYSCDCNRALFFARAIGEAEPWDRECSGAKNEFLVTSVRLDGVAVYGEELPEGPCDSAEIER